MSKGERMASQDRPPTGIGRAAWSGHKPSRSSSSKHRPGGFSISCPNRKECRRTQDLTGALDRDRSIRCGADAPRTCPGCGTVIPIKGYVG